jgi:hypothetical protein
MTQQTSYVEFVAPEAELAFLDAQSLALPRAMSAIEAWDLIMAHPMPMLALAFRARDAISTRFGVKRIGGFSGQRQAEPKVGDHLDFFLIERIEARCLILTERDRHLDVMTCVTTTDQSLTITSSVKVHNFFGKLYMLPVGPAHRFIVRKMLASLRDRLRVEPE